VDFHLFQWSISPSAVLLILAITYFNFYFFIIFDEGVGACFIGRSRIIIVRIKFYELELIPNFLIIMNYVNNPVKLTTKSKFDGLK
jgi:hypothetical protein